MPRAWNSALFSEKGLTLQFLINDKIFGPTKYHIILALFGLLHCIIGGFFHLPDQ